MAAQVTAGEYGEQHADASALGYVGQYGPTELLVIASPATGTYSPTKEGYPTIVINNHFSGSWTQDIRAAAVKTLIDRAGTLTPEDGNYTLEQACALAAAVGAYPMLIRAKQTWGIMVRWHGFGLMDASAIIAIGETYDRLRQYGDMDKEIVKVLGKKAFPVFVATRLFRSLVQAEVVEYIPDPLQFAREKKPMTPDVEQRLHREMIEYQELVGSIITKVRKYKEGIDEQDRETIRAATRLLMEYAAHGGTVQPTVINDSFAKRPNAKVLMYYLLSPVARASVQKSVFEGLPLETCLVLQGLSARTKTAEEAVKAMEAGAVGIEELAWKVVGAFANNPPVFVLDISGSMEPAIKTLQAFVTLLERAGANKQREFVAPVVVFNDAARIIPTSNIGQVRAGGSTALYPALVIAERIAKRTGTFLIVLTDWEHNLGQLRSIRNEMGSLKDVDLALPYYVDSPPDLGYLNERSVSVVFGNQGVPSRYQQWDIIHARPPYNPNDIAVALARLLREKYIPMSADVTIEPGKITVTISS